VASPDIGLCNHTDAQEISGVITGLVPVIHVFIAASLFIAANEARRGWPDRVRP
jgi:TctA family transporter